MLRTSGEVKTNPNATSPCGLLHMDSPVLADQQKITYICSVRTLDAV